jgi:DNA polymerase-4
MALLEAAGPVIEPVSIDEAYLDFSTVITGHTNTDAALMASLPLARRLKEQIRNERRLTATIGIAANKLLAKIASDFQKPDGLTLIPERNKTEFLRSFPIRAIPGVGKVTEQTLKQAGIALIGDAQDYPGDLRALLGSFGPVLRRCALGEDDRPVEVGGSVKSISSEETFGRDTNDRPILRRCLRTQADELAAKLKASHLGAHTIQVKVRYSDFTTLTRQITFEEPVTEPEEIYRLACHLMARDKLARRPLRLLGLGLTGLGEPTVRQLELPLKRPR